MKNLMKTLKKKLYPALARLQSNDGQFVMDHAVVFVIIIVLGGVAVVLLKTFLENDLATLVKEKILGFFN